MGFAWQRGDFGWQVTALEAVLRGGLSRVMVRTEVSVTRVPCLLPDLGESESSLVGGRRGGGERETRHRMDAGRTREPCLGPRHSGRRWQGCQKQLLAAQVTSFCGRPLGGHRGRQHRCPRRAGSCLAPCPPPRIHSALGRR